MIKKFILATILVAATNTQGKFQIVEYVEDPYLANAPKEIADHVQKIAELINFDKKLEILVPKKPAVLINPWNKLISSGINPITKNTIITINQDFYASLPKDQQDAKIAVSLENVKEKNYIPNIVWAMFALLSIGLMICAYLTLKKTILAGHSKWIIGLAAFATGALIELAITGKLEQKVVAYFNTRRTIGIYERVIQKTGNRDAAIKSLEAQNAIIQKELADGEIFFKPHEKTHKNLIEKLRRN